MNELIFCISEKSTNKDIQGNEMNVQTLNLDEETACNIRTLQLKMELLEKKRFRVNKHLEEIVLLLKEAEKSRNVEVRKALNHFINRLDTEKYYFFKTLGVDVGMKSYDTANSSNSEPASQIANKTSPQQKRRLVYRGQESWS